jgi:glycosyltransferase involved in cell wall biosynthesis
MKKVLFITYFWPPSGKASLHWPLAIIKHLPEHGWQPSVLTVDEDTFTQKDESLLNEVDPMLRVVKTASNDPFQLYRTFLGKKSDAPLIASETISSANTGIRHRIAVWIRMNLFVPDARIGWFFSAIRGGAALIRSEHIDAIVTNGPPHSAHLIGKYLSKRFSIPHIPVLIDPWVDIAYYRGFTRSAPTLALDKYFERSVFRHASHIIFVTNSAREAYVKKYSWIEGKASVLYWGYNEENFSGRSRTITTSAETAPVPDLTHGQASVAEHADASIGHARVEHITLDQTPDTVPPIAVRMDPSAKKEVLLHAGNIFDFQNPQGLWKNVKNEIDNGRHMTIRFIGTVSPGIMEGIDRAGLTPYTEYNGFLPFDRVVNEMCAADYLFVCATEKRHVPGKLFEYLRAGKPVIAFGDDNSEVESLLQTCTAGILFPYSYDKGDIFERLNSVRPHPGAALQYSRAHIAGALAQILNACTSFS